MRHRLILGLMALTIPAALSAQISIPILGRRGPDRPAEKPPQAPGIHDVRLYNRYALSRFSLETSPMLSYLQTSGFVAAGIPANYVTFGDATQLSFRAAPSLSVITAFTSSAFGGPFALGTGEFGLRLKPWTAPRIAVFADARMSWAYTTGMQLPSGAVPVAFVYRSMYNDSFVTGTGRGATLGFGVDTRITERYSVMTTVAHTRFDMRGGNLRSDQRWDYTTDATRLLVGFRYNHGRWLDAR
jgi:hypothetical protein